MKTHHSLSALDREPSPWLLPFERAQSPARKFISTLLLFATSLLFLTPIAFAADEALIDRVRAQIDAATGDRSTYKENFKLGTDQMKGVFPCDVHNIAIRRLRERALEAKGNEILGFFFREWLKAMSSIPSIARIPDGLIRPLIEVLTGEAADRLIREWQQRKQVRGGLLIAYESTRTSTWIPCKNGPETFRILADPKTGMMHIEVEAHSCCPTPATAEHVREYRARVSAQINVDSSGSLILSGGRVDPDNTYGSCCDKTDDFYHGMFEKYHYAHVGGKKPAANEPEEVDLPSFEDMTCKELEVWIKETYLRIRHLNAKIKESTSSGNPATYLKEERDQLEPGIEKATREWLKRCSGSERPDEMMVEIVLKYGGAVPPDEEKRDEAEKDDDKNSSTLRGPGDSDESAALPGDSIKFNETDFRVDPVNILNSSVSVSEPFEIQPLRSGHGDNAFNENTPAGPSTEPKRVAMPFPGANTITHVGFSNSPDHRQDVIEFRTDDTLFVRVEHLNLDPEVDRVELGLEQHGNIRRERTLSAQADGSFTGAMALGAFASGEVTVTVRGLAVLTGREVREVLLHQSEILVQAPDPVRPATPWLMPIPSLP